VILVTLYRDVFTMNMFFVHPGMFDWKSLSESWIS